MTNLSLARKIPSAHARTNPAAQVTPNDYEKTPSLLRISEIDRYSHYRTNDPARSLPSKRHFKTVATSARGHFFSFLLHMTRRYAILLDGGFIRKRLGSQLQKASPPRSATPDDIILECERIAKHPDLASLVLLRIYFYDAPPATGIIENPLDGQKTNFGQTPVFREQTSFLDTLELKPNIAYRKGEIVIHGWKVKPTALSDIAKTKRSLQPSDLTPNIQQKGVDLRIGLDIARLSLQKLVDTIVIVTGDADMVPACKFARREGVRIYLDHMGGHVHRDLRAHVDVVI